MKAVQNVNDPTIVSDDVQRWSKVALFALLAFTTLLSAASYLKFFEKSFGFNLAFVMALLLACIIEFGKNWGTLKVLRIPFFQGWRFVSSEVSNTVMWLGLVLLAIVTFSASVHNSTRGAHQLSLLLSHERTHTNFKPNTADIDGQIAAAEKRISESRATRWKGTTTVESQRTIRRETSVLEGLQRQRETAIQQQRADWEKQDAIRERQNNFSANSLLAVGGWVELLQLILMFVRVAAERSLDKTASERKASAPPHQHTAASNGQQHKHNGQAAHNETFFNRQEDGSVRSALPTYALSSQPLFHDDTKTPVSQSPQTVTQIKSAEAGDHADDVLKLALTRLQGHAANFDRKHGKNETTAANIHEILDKTLYKMKGTFRPSVEVHARFSAYILDALFPLLHEKGHPYLRRIQFEGWLRTVQPHEWHPIP